MITAMLEEIKMFIVKSKKEKMKFLNVFLKTVSRLLRTI